MLSSKLEGLPTEIILRICEYIVSTHKSSLLTFALVSKQCHCAATALLFRTIKISLRGSKQLAYDVQQCINRLQRAFSVKHVRRLVVEGLMRSQQDDTGEIEPQDRMHRPGSFRDHDDDELSDRRLAGVPVADRKPPNVVYEEDEAWTPLANLVRQLPALSDLIYACSSQFSPCLLQALHQHRPNCRLHVQTCSFRSLDQPDPDAHELALATSPCLYSVLVRYDSYNSDGIENYHEEAVMRIAAGLAPNLKEARVFRAAAGWSLALMRAFETPRKPWQGFALNKQKHISTPGSLRHLQLAGHGCIIRQVVENWSRHTDFSVLRTLELESDIEADVLHCLATKCDFSSLKTLVMILATENLLESPTMNHSSLANHFLCSLPSLFTLKLVGELSHITLGTIFEYHGAALRRLWLSPLGNLNRLVIAQREVERIAEHCPLLEDLSLTVPRFKGDAGEVAIYKALGFLCKLQSIFLTLDASDCAIFMDGDDDDETPIDSSFDNFDQQFFDDLRGSYRKPRNGHLRDAFINSTLDETLARAIFRSISTAKTSGALPLERLKLRVTGEGCFGDSFMLSSIEDVVGHLGRSWLLKRNPRDDHRHELVATELGRQEREAKESVHLISLGWNVEPIFRRIWSKRWKADGDWRDDWHSWPLS